jgi:hypothetical protein
MRAEETRARADEMKEAQPKRSDQTNNAGNQTSNK